MRRVACAFALLVFGCSDPEASSSGDGGGTPERGGTSGTGASGGSAGSANGGTASGGASGAGSSNGGASATGGDSSGGGASGSGGSAGTGGGGPSGCARMDVAPTDNPDHVVGTGTPASCTESELRTAATAGGTIVFDCGPDPVTITVTSTIVFTKESVLEGGGLVTLSGGGSERILLLDSAYDLTTPRLTVQRLDFRDGNSPSTGDDTADGGGAIYRDGGSLSVLFCNFDDNQAPATGQDLAGGAIYGFGGGETIIYASTFVGNSASDGGAVGSLNGDLVIIDSRFEDNHATGTDGNPGNGGCGGAIYIDGGDETTTLCDVGITDNTAGHIGGGVFRVSNSDDGTFTMQKSTVSGNRVTRTDDGNAGGMYLQGLDLTISDSTISGNEAFYGGGVWISERRATLTNVTIAENTAFGSNGGGVWLANDPMGTMLNCTVANNHSTAQGMIAGAIFGGGLALKNTIVSGNTAMYTPGCSDEHDDGGGNLQFPGGALCVENPTIADPALGALGDNGGPTETLLPAASSPAVGLGMGCPPADQRGEQRGEPCTAGAVEAP